MKRLVPVLVLLAACGGTDAPASVDRQETVAAPAAPAAPVSWHFTAADVSGLYSITQSPMGPGSVSLSGTATVGAQSGTVNGFQDVASGAFVLYIALPGTRQVQISGRDAGTTFAGYVLDTAGFPVVRGRTDYSEPVTGTSP